MSNALAPEVRFCRLANALTRSGYDDFFQTLVDELSHILNVEYVLIAQVTDEKNRARTLAVSSHGQAQSNFSYDLHGTPCETVPERSLCHYRQGVVSLFPEDALLRELNVESYTGMPILTSIGQKLGFLSVMARRPLTLSDVDQEILRIASAQVGSELELSSSHKRIRSLTYEDIVTGLPNRHQLLKWLDVHQDVTCLLLIDIRRFKDINDLYGHVIGDAILFAVAERLTSRLGDRGYVARLSGDEFALVPNGFWQIPAEDMVREIQHWFQQPVTSDAAQFHLDITTGAATAEGIARDGVISFGAELLRRTGLSLAEAKAQSRAFMMFDPVMIDSRQLRQEMYEKLRRALRENRLSLAFQPQLCLKTGELIGAEALCRWHDEELGWISPAQFIPLAEERGLIGEVGDWVLRTACRQLDDWEKAGHRFDGKLSVNISNVQLESDAFAESALAILGQRDPSSVMLELTETAMMIAPEVHLRQMDRLTAKGFSWAIDDFGTGYSSLSYLTRMNAQFLKIDRSFVSRIPGSPHDESVIRTIVAMAQSLGMELIAEGIETEAQLSYLRMIGVGYGQGFYIGRPSDARSFGSTWLYPSDSTETRAI